MALFSLTEATAGRSYQIKTVNGLSNRLALMGVSAGVLVELIALYRHGALLKTPFGEVALGPELINGILVSHI